MKNTYINGMEKSRGKDEKIEWRKKKKKERQVKKWKKAKYEKRGGNTREKVEI